MFVTLVISGCIGNPTGNSSSGSLVLNISESGVTAKTIEPGLDMTITVYDIIGTGPNGANFQKNNITPGAPVTINTLAVGAWTIEVDAKNAGGTLIASGVTTVTVTAGTTANASVTVRPIDGTGVLNITVSWPTGIITNPSVTGTLIPVNGTAQNISYTLAGDRLSATYQNNTIPTGYYTLITQLKDGSTLKWSAVDAVRIINGQTSTGAYALTAVQGQFGDIELVVTPDLQNPIAITFSGQQSSLQVGTDMTVTATTSEAVDAYQWYLNGTPLPGATNASLTIGRTLGLGDYLLAVVVTKGNIISSQSFGFSVAASLEKIVFTSERDGNCEIYTMNPDGSNQVRLTDNPGADLFPAWAPDRSKVAFISNRDGNYQIYVMNSDGSNQTRLTYNTSFEAYPSWTPDGAKLIFVSDRTGSFQVYRMNADGSGQIQLGDNAGYYARCSPDGQRILFTSQKTGNEEIYIMNIDGGEQMQLTHNSGKDFNPNWSPDGNQIVFASERDGNEEIYVMNQDGSNQTRLTHNPYQDYYPDWSPDGRKIVFNSNRDSGGNGFDIYSMDASGGNLTKITDTRENEYPDW